MPPEIKKEREGVIDLGTLRPGEIVVRTQAGYKIIKPSGEIVGWGEEKRSHVPAYARDLFPVIIEAFPEEFLKVDTSYDQVVQMEGKLKQKYSGESPTEIYRRVCARLAKDGVSADRVSRFLLKQTDLETKRWCGWIKDEDFDLQVAILADKIRKYYPGAEAVKKKRKLRSKR